MKLHRHNVTKVHIVDQEETKLSLDMFDLDCHKPALTLVGSTKYKEPEMMSLRPFFKVLAEALTLQDFPVVVIDGATNFGVMKLFNDACEQVGKEPAALIGVTLREAIEEEEIPLGLHHSHVLLTPGNSGHWVAEVPWMRQVQSIVTGERSSGGVITHREKPSALLAVGGGSVTLRHMQEHALASVPLYVLVGSGPLPQGFIEAGKDIPDPAYPYPIDEHRSLLETGLVTLLDTVDPYQAIDKLMESLYKTEREFAGEDRLILADSLY